MNEILNKFLLAGDNFMPGMHLRQRGFTFSACEPFTKSKERIQAFKKAGDSKYIYQNELDKACFQDDIVYGDFKDLTSRTGSDKILRGIKHLTLQKIRNMMDIKEVLLQWFSNFFIKKLQVVPIKMKFCQTKN